jgi:crossover junction endodeoxyribonuclease RuvC
MGVSPKQFAAMEARLSGRAPTASGTSPGLPESGLHLPEGSRVLGIDPSLRGTGWGVIQIGSGGQSPIFVEAGTIRCPKSWERSRCLGEIGRKMTEVIQRHPPALCACEGLFFAQNLQTALIMGEARGAAIAAVARTGIEIHEISPRKVKLAMVGYGAAQKIAVAKMVQRQLSMVETPDADAADALALALVMVQELRNPLGPASKRV